MSALERWTSHRCSGACSTWPTATANDSRNGRNATANRKPGSKHHSGRTLCDAVNSFPATGLLNPPWVEWLMGFPHGWTEVDA